MDSNHGRRRWDVQSSNKPEERLRDDRTTDDYDERHRYDRPRNRSSSDRNRWDRQESDGQRRERQRDRSPSLRDRSPRDKRRDRDKEKQNRDEPFNDRPSTDNRRKEERKASQSAEKSQVAPLQVKIDAKPVTTPNPAPIARPKSKLVAQAFGDDSSDEEEMPPEAKMRMRNIGRDTPTSAGPNSYAKGKLGFCDNKRIVERHLMGEDMFRPKKPFN